jgi:hypothetical protein
MILDMESPSPSMLMTPQGALLDPDFGRASEPMFGVHQPTNKFLLWRILFLLSTAGIESFLMSAARRAAKKGWVDHSEKRDLTV